MAAQKLNREARCQQTKARNEARRQYRLRHPNRPARDWRHAWPLAD